MRFGLIVRGQYPEGDDMRVRLKEDIDAAVRMLAGSARSMGLTVVEG